MGSGSTTARDIGSAYLASGVKIGAWVVVSALVYRWLGPGNFAMLALVRATVGVLNYTSLGIGPALVHHLARSQALPVVPMGEGVAEAPVGEGRVLSYAVPREKLETGVSPGQQAYTTGVVVTLLVFALGAAVVIGLPVAGNRMLGVPTEYWQVVPDLLVTMGFGILARVLSEPAGAVLQTFGRIATDNVLIALADVLWVVLFALTLRGGLALDQAGSTFLWSSLFLLLMRHGLARRHLKVGVGRVPIDPHLATSLLGYGVMLTVAQLADFLYAPTDYLIISHLLSTEDLTAYAPCVQIDAALLLLVTGLSAVLFPKAALAHARADRGALRRYYVKGTVFSVVVLVVGAGAAWLLGPVILRLWLREVPAGTMGVLPLVLVHTVLGGSSAVGRAILLGAGRVKAFTVAVLVSGVVNVVVSYVLVKYTGLGLYGVVIGTLVAVAGRCVGWMPWYVRRVLRGG